MQLSPALYFFLPLRPKCFLNILLSTPVRSCYSLKTIDQVSHLHNEIGKISILYILIFAFIDRQREDKKFSVEW
jgi:hypothetical protein